MSRVPVRVSMPCLLFMVVGKLAQTLFDGGTSQRDPDITRTVPNYDVKLKPNMPRFLPEC